MRNLLKMYESARADSVVPVPVTVPSIRVEAADGGAEAAAFVEQHLSSRRELNGLIADYAQAKRLAWIDLFSATADPLSGQLRGQYSNDGLHLTTAGYRLFAQLLYDQIFAKVYPPSSASGT